MLCHCSLLENRKGGGDSSRRPSRFGGLVEAIGAIFERSKAGKWLLPHNASRLCSRPAERRAQSMRVQ